MIKLIDLTYYSHNEYTNYNQVLEHHKASLGYISFIKNKLNVAVIKHLNYDGHELINEVKYSFFKSNNKFFHIPFKTHRFIKSINPDIVLVQGLLFPLQVIFLRLALGKKVKILAQHHGENPFTGIKKIFLKIADRYVDGYLFTSLGNATTWLSQGIINKAGKCHEVLEASTFFTKQDKHASRELLGITGKDIFLWVGRLEKNKDPLTILSGFEKFQVANPGTILYMIFQEDDLLKEVQEKISSNPLLQKQVHLIGKVEHGLLPHWFSAADFYLSGSHKEGSGYALIEAMACGCIPVVTDIPPFRKIVGNYGFSFEVGNPESLANVLSRLSSISKNECSAAIEKHFQQQLSFEKIAQDIYAVCTKLNSI